MAFSFTAERKAVQTGSVGGSQVLSPNSNMVAGVTIIIVHHSPVTGKHLTSVTDNAGGNTWTVDHTYDDGSGNSYSFASCTLATTVTTTNTVTLNFSSATSGNTQVWFFEVAASSPISFDKSADALGSGTTVTCGPTATLSSAESMAFMCATGSGTFTKDASFTNPTTPVIGSNGCVYKILSSTSAVSGTATFGTTANAGSLVTYKASSAVTVSAVPASASSAARAPVPTATIVAVRLASSSAFRIASPTLVVAGARSAATSAARTPAAAATVTVPRQNASAAARAPVPRFQITQPRAQATSVLRVPGILIPTTVVAPRMAAASAMRTVGIASVPNLPGTVVVTDRAVFSVTVTDTTVGTVTVSAS